MPWVLRVIQKYRPEYSLRHTRHLWLTWLPSLTTVNVHPLPHIRHLWTTWLTSLTPSLSHTIVTKETKSSLYLTDKIAIFPNQSGVSWYLRNNFNWRGLIKTFNCSEYKVYNLFRSLQPDRNNRSSYGGFKSTFPTSTNRD